MIKKPGKTVITIVAVSKSKEDNVSLRIRCKGNPIGGYFFDTNNDCYVVSGVDFLPLGEIPFIAFIYSEEYNGWSSDCPLPEKIILKNLDKSKVEYLDKFFENYKGLDFKYVQYTQAEET